MNKVRRQHPTRRKSRGKASDSSFYSLFLLISWLFSLAFPSPRRLPITLPLPSLRSLLTRVTGHSLRSFPSVYDVSEWRVNRESPTDTSGETKGTGRDRE